MISENLISVKSRIAEAAMISGRDSNDISLVAVSKTVSQEKILEAQKAGADIFGENKVQEVIKKINDLGKEKFHWHFIGHVQKNKVKNIIGLFELIHSVDSVELAEKIHRASLKKDIETDILIQVNISGESSKSGVAPDELEKVLSEVSKYEGVNVRGLMTIPPFDPEPEKSRPYFSQLRELRDSIQSKRIENISLQELSMGMSNDFNIAIEEGATMVRVGTAIFGERE
ncbi:MAG: YggS family pyridoxal phosphate-dependent enzyme [Nitrospinales bacterium]